MLKQSFFEYEVKRENEGAGLFCFHYAGGNASFYADWFRYLNDEIGVYPFQLPGRGRLVSTEKFSGLTEAAEVFAQQISEYSGKTIILTGHSMGGLLAYKTAYILESRYNIPVSKLFITGSYPQLGTDNIRQTADLSDEEFCKVLREYNGINEKVFKIKQFYRLFLPVIKEDFKMTGDFTVSEDEILSCDINVYGGKSDKIVLPEKLELWKKFTTGSVRINMQDGDHFFINSAKEHVCEDINEFYSKCGSNKK